MALRLIDGFDFYSAGQWAERGWVCPNVGISAMVAGRFGGQAVQVSSGGSGAVSTRNLPSTYLSFVSGFAFNLGNPGNLSRTFFRFRTPGGAAILDFAIDAALKVVQVAGLNGTHVITAGTWHYIEVKVTINGAASTVEVHLDGASEIASTTVNLGTTGAAQIMLINDDGLSGSVSNVYDDFYFCDLTGAHNNDFLGDVQIAALMPSADGAHTDWTPNSGTAHFSRVNETPADADTSYVATTTVGARDSYAFADLSAIAGSVFGVQESVQARKDNTATRQIALVCRPGITDHDGATQTLAGGYQFFSEVTDVNPDTSVPWTIADVDAAEFGIKLVA